jgi:H(+)-transporting ATP synthase, vacuolar type, subunit D
MPKIKLTKGELKRQRDSLRQYRRYLPTLQLKKQQLQMEILRQHVLLSERRSAEIAKIRDVTVWAGLLTDATISVGQFLKPDSIKTTIKNIAGVDVPIFESAEFLPAEYDLFSTPMWLDAAINILREVISLRSEIAVLEKGIAVLKAELRTTTQRVNLFEKVKIPEAEEAVRRIKIFIGDQMTNAVGRSKIAKKKIEAAIMLETHA